jgi:hypothetical protein
MAEGFVTRQANRLLEILKEEHKLKIELLHLDLGPQPAPMLNKNLERQWAILGQLRSINMDRKIPILRELTAFIGERLKEKGQLPAPAADKASGKRK